MKPHPIETDRKATEPPYTRGDLSLPPGWQQVGFPQTINWCAAEPIQGDPAYWITRSDGVRILVRERQSWHHPTDAVGRAEVRCAITRALDAASLRKENGR